MTGGKAASVIDRVSAWPSRCQVNGISSPPVDPPSIVLLLVLVLDQERHPSYFLAAIATLFVPVHRLVPLATPIPWTPGPCAIPGVGILGLSYDLSRFVA